MTREKTLDDFADTKLPLKRWKMVQFGNVVNQIKDRLKEPEKAGIKRYIAGRHFTPASLKLNGFGEFGDGTTGPAFHMRVKKGQILFVSRRAYLRKVAIAEFEAICSNIVYIMEANGADLIQEYLPFLMQSESFVNFTINNSKGSTNPYLNWKDIAKYEFLLPPITEQWRISNILWGIEKSIGKVDKVITKTQRLKKGLMENLLTKGIVHTEFKQTELGEIPQTWKISTLGEKITLQRGFDITKKQQVEGPYPVISSSGITSYHNEFKVKGPGVIIGRKGSLGTVFYTDSEYWPHDTTLWVKDFKTCKPKFVYYFLKHLNLKKYSYTTAVPTLNRNHIHPLKIAMPEYEEQEKIASILSRTDDSLILIGKHREVLLALKKRLLNDLIK